MSERKIPVPSFAPPPPIANDASETIHLAVNEQSMIHLENALQLHVHQQKQQSGSDVISFTDFSRISSKVETSHSTPDDDTKIENEPETPVSELTQVQNLSRAERFWHDLYCVAVPVLYCATKKSETDSTGPRPKKRRRLAAVALELTPRPAAELELGRVGELRRLVREANTKGVLKSKSDKALSLLLAFRQEKENNDKTEPTKESNTSQKANSVVDSLLRDSSSISNSDKSATTIDERIRARAKERERNLEQAKAAAKDPREERVAIADALYSYASHVLRRRQSRSQNRFSETKNTASKATTNSKKCVLTFGEIVQDGLPNRSRKEIGRIMSDIVKVLRGSDLKFLKWKDPKTGETCGIPISKNATVTIDTSDFKQLREILNRKKI